MGIVVKHEGNAGAYAAGAYESGSGKRRAQDRAQASQAVASEMAQSRQAAHASRARQIAGLGASRGIRGREDDAGLTKRGVRLPTRRIESDQIGRGPIREGSIESNQIGRRTTVGQQGAGALSEKNQEYLEKKKLDSMYDLETRRRDKEKYDYEQQMQRSKYDYEQYMDRNKFDYQYTSKQKEEVDKLNNLYEMARNSQMFTDEELPEIKRQIFNKIAGIEKMPTLKDEEQPPLERAQASMFTDPETGRRGYINKDGEPQFFKSEVDTQKESVDKQRESIVKRYRELADKPVIEQKEVTVGGKKIPQDVPRYRTPEEIKEIIDAEQAFMDSYFNPEAAAPAGKVVDANGDTTYYGDTGLAIMKTENLFRKLRGMDQRKLTPEAKAVLRLGEDGFYAAAQEKANAQGISVNEYISIVMKGLTQ